MKYFTIFLILFTSMSNCFSQEFLISSHSNNKAYKGVPNRLEVLVSGVSSKYVLLKTDNGDISRNGIGSAFVLTPGRTGKAEIKIYRIQKKDTMLAGSQFFQVLDIPDPAAKVF